MSKILTTAIALGAVLAACASPPAGGPPGPVDGSSTPGPPAVEHEADGVVIGHMRTARARLSVVSTPAGLRFDVRSRDGAQVERGLTAAQLASRHGELSELYRSGTAAGEGPYLDASLQPPRAQRPDPR